MVRGSRGQSRLHPAAIEVRHPRLALARLLGDVRLPADDQEGRSETAASQRASHAAQARWSKTVTNAERERRLCGA